MNTTDPAAPSGQAVVVGATGEVGAAIVVRLRKAGMPVVAVARDRHRLELLRATDDGIVACPADIGDDSSGAAIAAAVSGPVRWWSVSRRTARRTAGDDRARVPWPVGFLEARGTAASYPRCGRPVCPWFPDRRHRRPLRFRTHAANLRGRCYQRCSGQSHSPARRRLRATGGYRAHGRSGCLRHRPPPSLRRRARRGADVRLEAVLDEYRSHSPLGRMTTVDQVSWAVTQLLAPEADALHGSTLALDGGARRGLF